MPSWAIGIVVILVVGIAVIGWGYFRDKELSRRRAERILGQPDRVIPGYDREATTPAYVTAVQARTPPAEAPPPLSPEQRQAIRDAVAGVKPLSIGYAAKEFANDAETGWAALTEPLVLVCAEPVEAIRELLPLVDLSRRLGAPMVVVAPRLSRVVVDTLAVNRIQQFLGVLAVQTESLETQFAIAEQTRAAVVDRTDLQGGYLPPERVGRCAYWVSTAKQTWIVSSPPQ